MKDVKHIYLDNSATTRISEAALEKLIEVSRECYGNPSSLHSFGLLAEKEISAARAAVLDSLSAKDCTVIFTASGSEANNLAIIGRALSKDRYRKGAKIITTSGEHASVSSPIARLREMGFKSAEIPTKDGIIDLDALKAELTADTVLVSIMMVNNETGALYDTKAVTDLVRSISPEALIHIDATQSYMKVKFTKQSCGADMITLSSHKINGPKGVGTLLVDNKILKQRGLCPMILGGGQEGGLRSGTENVPAIAAFGVAIRENLKSLDESISKMSALREMLIEKISTSEELRGISITLPKNHAPHILNITLPNIKSEVMLHYLSSLGIFVSSGSACSSNSSHLSTALISYGKTPKDADSSIRISFSHENEASDVEALCEGLASGIKRLARIR